MHLKYNHFISGPLLFIVLIALAKDRFIMLSLLLVLLVSLQEHLENTTNNEWKIIKS